MGYLDNKGLTYLWSKIKTKIDSIIVPTALSQLTSDSTHRTVTDTEKTTWNNKSNFSGNYSDLSNIPVISIRASTGSETWYYPLGKMRVDDSGNYGSFTFIGRIGGWTNQNSATFSIMLMNRADYTGDIITSTVSASGQVTSALNICDLLVTKESDKSHTVYIKCKTWAIFDCAWTAFQHSIIYDGSYSTTEPSNIIWRLSEAPKTILAADGSFEASGGIDANKFAGRELRIVTDENDTGKAGYFTVII